MTAYPNMKASGVSWVAAMPAHWESVKIGSLFSQRKAKVSDKVYTPLSVTKNGIVPQLANAAKSNDSDNRKLVCAGDFVINSRSDRKGSCGVSELTGSVSLINTVLKPRQGGNNRYVHYLLRSQPFSEEFYRCGRGIVADLWTTRFSEMKEIMLPVPPRTEQDQIVRFLDWKVSGINRLINIKKKEIARLGELKKTIVNEAVTHGINPNIPMKSSGVEWLGDIPEHWNTLKLKRISKERKEKQLYTPNTTDKYIGLENIKRDSEQLIITKSEYDKSIQNFCHKGDLLFGKLRPYLSKVIVCPYDSCCTNELLVLYSFAGNIHFLRYVMVSKSFIQIVDSSTYGAKMPRANTNYIMNMFVPLPPIEEQNLIVKYLNKQIGRIDFLIDRVIKQISLLQELKARLISDVATGQIDVRNIEVPKYEYVEENSDADPDSDDESEDVTDEED